MSDSTYFPDEEKQILATLLKRINKKKLKSEKSVAQRPSIAQSMLAIIFLPTLISELSTNFILLILPSKICTFW